MAADVGLPAGFVLDQSAPAPQGLPPGFQLDQDQATPAAAPAPVTPPESNVAPSDRPTPIGRLDRTNEIEGAYTDNQGQLRIVNPATDMVGDDGNVYPRQAGRPGDVVNRGTLLPFVETLGPDGQRQPGLGLPEIIAGPVDRANRLLTEPAAPSGRPGGQNESAIFDALQAGQMGMGSVRVPVTQAYQQEARALANRVGPPAPVQGPVRPPPVPVESVGDVAARAGVDLPRAAAGGAGTRAVAGTVRDLPFVGAPLVRAANRATEQMEAGIGRVADDLGPSSRVGAGHAARDSIIDWVERRSADDMARAYDDLDKLINPATAVPLSRTQAAVKALRDSDVASATRDGQAAINLVREAIARPGMTYDGIKGLRTSIGNRLSGDIDDSGISNRALQSLYSALSEDLKFVVGRAGTGKKGSNSTQALAAFERANSRASEIFEQRTALTKIIGRQADAPGEAVADRILAMASARRGGDIERIALARRVMDPAAWDDLAGSIVRQMGRHNDEFSLARWHTEYTKLSDAGRTALFGSGRGSHRAALDDIAELAKYAKQLQRTGNPSQSGRFGSLVAAPAWAFAHPVSFIAAVTGGRFAASYLSKPVTAQAAAQALKAARALNRQPNSIGKHQAFVASVKAFAAAMGEDPAEVEARLLENLPAPQPRPRNEIETRAPTQEPGPTNAMAGLSSSNAMASTQQGTRDKPIPVRTRADVSKLPAGVFVVNERGEVFERR